ncbi:MAG: DUF2812 domain-containing protein [Bacillota bacterium]
MKHVIRKAYWNFIREEDWLNRLAAQGLALTDYSWCRYVFEDSQPGEYIFRIELLDHLPAHPESRRYIEFVESTGAECVSTYMRWVYFRKKAADGPFELYSDNASRIRHLRRVRAFWLGFVILEFGAFVLNLVVGLVPPISTTNLVCAAVLGPLFALFFTLFFGLTRRIRALKRAQKLTEG